MLLDLGCEAEQADLGHPGAGAALLAGDGRLVPGLAGFRAWTDLGKGEAVPVIGTEEMLKLVSPTP